MPGHIFDANILRNFVLCSAEHFLLVACPGPLYWSGVVKKELSEGPAGFARVHKDDIDDGDVARIRQLEAFQGLETSLNRLGFINLKVTFNPHLTEAMEFFACCYDIEEMDPGEAESLALAVYRGFTFYTDDLNAYDAVERYNAKSFACPRPGSTPPPNALIEVHSTPWVLLELVRLGRLSMTEAEAVFLDFKEVWYRHPHISLAELESDPDSYW